MVRVSGRVRGGRWRRAGVRSATEIRKRRQPTGWRDGPGGRRHGVDRRPGPGRARVGRWLLVGLPHPGGRRSCDRRGRLGPSAGGAGRAGHLCPGRPRVPGPGPATLAPAAGEPTPSPGAWRRRPGRPRPRRGRRRSRCWRRCRCRGGRRRAPRPARPRTARALPRRGGALGCDGGPGHGGRRRRCAGRRRRSGAGPGCGGRARVSCGASSAAPGPRAGCPPGRGGGLHPGVAGTPRPEPGFRWPERFGPVHGLGYAAGLLLGLEAVVDGLRRRSQSPSDAGVATGAPSVEADR